MSQKIFILAGEPSGDLHGSNLVKALKTKRKDLTIEGWGGDKMEAQGVNILKHYRDMAFMGFIEVIANIRTIKKNFKAIEKHLETSPPDVLILIDFPGFNLRVAKFAKKLGIKVVYYISPQIWAWKQGRVHQIKKVVDRMMVILPFEKDFYAKWDYAVDFVGHPLLDEIENYQLNEQPITAELEIEKNKPIVALLPGSRQQEVKNMLEIMKAMPPQFPEANFVIGKAPSLDLSFYNEVLKGTRIKVYNNTYQLLQQSHAALVTSGTATLETALFEVPQVVCYKASAISYAIAKRLVKGIKYISLVNLIADKELVKELIQEGLNEKNLKRELEAIMKGQKREQLLSEYKALKEKLGGTGASNNAAEIVLDELEK